MPYRINVHSKFKKSLDKLKNNKALKTDVREATQHIIDNPDVGSLLEGNLAGVRKVVIQKGRRPEFRLFYTFVPCCKGVPCQYTDTNPPDNESSCDGVIDFIDIMTRENATKFYKQARNVVMKWLRT